MQTYNNQSDLSITAKNIAPDTYRCTCEQNVDDMDVLWLCGGQNVDYVDVLWMCGGQNVDDVDVLWL